MKSTGIVRRIDELGRIVIPKEIRNNLRINETDNIEIYVENEAIILKKYSLIKSLNDIASSLTEAISNYMKKNIIITDTNSIISCSGSLKKKISNKNISEYLLAAIKRRENIFENHIKELEIIESDIEECSYIIKSILNKGDVVGLFIVVSFEKEVDNQDKLISEIGTEFLSKYLEK